MGSIQIEYCTLIIPARKDDKIAAIVFRKAGIGVHLMNFKTS